MRLQQILKERIAFPLKTDAGSLTVVVHDSHDELFAVIDPVLPRDLQLAVADFIRDRANGPMLDATKLYRECYSGVIRRGDFWNEDFQRVVNREFVEIDIRDEIGGEA